MDFPEFLAEGSFWTPHREHLERVRLFLHAASLSGSPSDRLRFVMAAVYSARAITDHITEAVRRKTIPTHLQDRQFKKEFQERLRHFDLIDAVRRHDFHVRALRLSPITSIQGTRKSMTLTSRQGKVAQVQFAGTPVVTKAGNSTVELGEPLEFCGAEVRVVGTGDWIKIEDAVLMYAEDVEELITEYEAASESVCPRP